MKGSLWLLSAAVLSIVWSMFLFRQKISRYNDDTDLAARALCGNFAQTVANAAVVGLDARGIDNETRFRVKYVLAPGYVDASKSVHDTLLTVVPAAEEKAGNESFLIGRRVLLRAADGKYSYILTCKN